MYKNVCNFEIKNVSYVMVMNRHWDHCCFRLGTESDGNDNHNNQIDDKSQNTDTHE
jgi:hypothetical protein